MNNSYIVATIDNGPVSVYRMTIPDEMKMDFILDTMDNQFMQAFCGEDIKRVKIIGEILKVKQILKQF